MARLSNAGGDDGAWRTCPSGMEVRSEHPRQVPGLTTDQDFTESGRAGYLASRRADVMVDPAAYADRDAGVRRAMTACVMMPSIASVHTMTGPVGKSSDVDTTSPTR